MTILRDDVRLDPIVRRGKLCCPRDETRLVWEPRPAGAMWTCPTCHYDVCLSRDGPAVTGALAHLGAAGGNQKQQGGEPTVELQSVTMPAGNKAPAMRWEDLAAARLRELLAQIAVAAELRREAARIHTALTVYGLPPEPLPWALSIGAHTSTDRRNKRSHIARPCGHCGGEFFPHDHSQRYCSRSCGSSAVQVRLRAQRAEVTE